MEAVVALIASVCMLNNPKVPHDKKVTCIEKMVNCAVDQNGEVNLKTAQQCKEKLK